MAESCARRIVLIVDDDEDGEVEKVLRLFPAGCCGEEVRVEARALVKAWPGRLLAVEHQGWYAHPQCWVRFLWLGGKIQEEAMKETKRRKR